MLNFVVVLYPSKKNPVGKILPGEYEMYSVSDEHLSDFQKQLDPGTDATVLVINGTGNPPAPPAPVEPVQ